MSPEMRSRVMARIRGRDTKPELTMAALLIEAGIDFESHTRGLPDRPGFVFHDRRVAAFCDGGFWLGWRLEQWRRTFPEKW